MESNRNFVNITKTTELRNEPIHYTPTNSLLTNTEINYLDSLDYPSDLIVAEQHSEINCLNKLYVKLNELDLQKLIYCKCCGRPLFQLNICNLNDLGEVYPFWFIYIKIIRFTILYFIFICGLNIGGGLIIRNLSFDYKDSGDKYKLNLNDLSFFNLIIIFVFFISYYVNLIIVNSLEKTNSFCNLNKTPEEYTIIVTNLPGDKDEEELKIELTEVIYFIIIGRTYSF